MTYETVMIKGPMHPDMFDGESPIMIEVKVDAVPVVYRCDVNFESTARIYVVAEDDIAAEEMAIQEVTDDLGHVSIDAIEASVTPQCEKALGKIPDFLYKDKIDNFIENHRIDEAA